MSRIPKEFWSTLTKIEILGGRIYRRSLPAPHYCVMSSWAEKRGRGTEYMTGLLVLLINDSFRQSWSGRVAKIWLRVGLRWSHWHVEGGTTWTAVSIQRRPHGRNACVNVLAEEWAPRRWGTRANHDRRIQDRVVEGGELLSSLGRTYSATFITL